MPVAMMQLVAVGFAVLVPAVCAAQPAADGAAGDRTPWGDPDLQGIWDFRTITPLERPGELAGTDVLSAEEAAVQEALTAAERVDRVPERAIPASTTGSGWIRAARWSRRGAPRSLSIRRTAGCRR